MTFMLCSRLLAFLSTTAYITFFGVNNTQINIYSYATKLPVTIFTILGTALTITVIPIFAGYIGTGEKERAFKFADNIISLSTLLTILLSVIGILAAPGIVRLTAFDAEQYVFAVLALQIMMPVMIFYGLNYIFQGMLQSLGRFSMPALVGAPGSLLIILYVYFLGNEYGVWGLLITTFIGLSLQALILIPPLLNTEYRYKPYLDYKNEDIKRALKLIPPIIVATSAYQLNMLFNITVTANFENVVTLMTFVQDTILYSVLIFIYSVTAVIFPKLTMLAAKKDMEGFKDSLEKVLKMVLYLAVPAAFGFIAIRVQLMELIMGWGKITPQDVDIAASILAFYALGVTGIGVKEIADRAFYALNDIKKPAVNGVIIMAVNISCSLIFIRFLGVLGIPLAYTLSAVTGGIVIVYMLWKKTGGFDVRALLVNLIKITLSSAIMFAAVMAVNSLLAGFVSSSLVVDRLLKLLVPVGAGGLVYFISTYVLRMEEATDVLDRVRVKLGRVKEG